MIYSVLAGVGLRDERRRRQWLTAICCDGDAERVCRSGSVAVQQIHGLQDRRAETVKLADQRAASLLQQIAFLDC